MKLMSLVSLNSITAEASRSAAFSCAHTASTTHAANTAKRAYKHVWPTATKSAFYANFYAVDEATGALIG
jgi:hypothetical protein